MPRGGKRQGTQGKAYSNRTDLAVNYAPGGNPAAGGAPIAPQRPAAPLVSVDSIPNLGDPSANPSQPVTTGLSIGDGPGPEAMGPMPPDPTDPVRMVVQAMMLQNANPDLLRVLNRLNYEGR